MLFSVNDHDLNGTPKIFKKSIFENINLVSKGWFIDAEVMIKFSELSSKIGDVPVVFKKREKGASKVNIRAVFGFIKEMLMRNNIGILMIYRRETRFWTS